LLLPLDEIEDKRRELWSRDRDAIQDAGVFRMRLLKAKGQDFYPGFFDLGGESGRRTICSDADFLADGDSCRISKPINNALSNVFGDALELDELTLAAEIRASLVPGIGGEQGAVSGNDRIGEKPQEFCDLHKDVEDKVVQGFAQTIFEMGKGGLTRQVIKIDTRVEAVVFPPFPITDYLEEALHIGIFLEVAKQLEQEKAHGVIGKSGGFISMGDDGSDKGEINQRGDEPGKPADDAPIEMDFCEPQAH